jgi:hypothetical protein
VAEARLIDASGEEAARGAGTFMRSAIPPEHARRISSGRRMTPRLTGSMLAGSLIRVCEAAGGHAMVLAKGDETAGSLLISLYHKGRVSGLFEQLLDTQGRYRWTAHRTTR